LPKLIEGGILIKTRRIKKSDYYKLNVDHPFIRDLIKLNWMLVKFDLNLIEEKKKIELNI